MKVPRLGPCRNIEQVERRRSVYPIAAMTSSQDASNCAFCPIIMVHLHCRSLDAWGRTLGIVGRGRFHKLWPIHTAGYTLKYKALLDVARKTNKHLSITFFEHTLHLLTPIHLLHNSKYGPRRMHVRKRPLRGGRRVGSERMYVPLCEDSSD